MHYHSNPLSHFVQRYKVTFLLVFAKLKHAVSTDWPQLRGCVLLRKHTLTIDEATAKTSKQRTIEALIAASPSDVLLRDGELVLYRRTRSLLYQ